MSLFQNPAGFGTGSIDKIMAAAITVMEKVNISQTA
jgi:hypothetical protein